MSADRIEQNVLVTGGAGYIGLYLSVLLPSFGTYLNSIGTHVIYELQKTRRYQVISIDNNHNSFPIALSRVSELSKCELPANATEAEKQSTEIISHKCDLTKPEEIKALFAKYGKGGIWGVIHIAVSLKLAVFMFVGAT